MVSEFFGKTFYHGDGFKTRKEVKKKWKTTLASVS